MTTLKKINILIWIFTVICLSLIVFLVFPLIREIKEDSSRLVSAKQELLSFDERVENLNRFKRDYPEIELDVQKIDNFFINQEAPVRFLDFLEKTAQETALGLDITPLPIPKKSEEDWPFLLFRINGQGSFPDSLRFIEKIENSPFLLEVDNFNIRKGSSGQEVTILITIKVFAKNGD